MQVRCRHCNRPYAVNRDEVHALLEQIHAEDLKYASSYCPHCGKMNRHSKKQLQQAAPTWKPEQSG